MLWTIAVGSVEKTLNDWGFKNVQRTLVNQGADTLVFASISRSTEGPTLTPGTQVILYRDRQRAVNNTFTGGTVWFCGTILKPSNARHQYTYAVVGPWGLMERTVCGQLWKNRGTTNLKNSHLLLCAGISVKQQITDLITYAASVGIPIQAGVIDELGYLPMMEMRDATIGECIRSVLRAFPDVVVWCDYSTTPPTMHVRRYGLLPSVTLEHGKSPLQDWDLTPEYDLVRPSVVLFFEKKSVDGGKHVLDITDQRYPLSATGFETNGLVCTINLQGSSTSYATAFVETAEINADAGTYDADATRLAWWKAHDNTLIDLTTLTIRKVKYFDVNGNEINWATYPLKRELVGGSVPEWLALKRGWSVEKIVVACQSFEALDDPLHQMSILKETDRKITCSIKVTNAEDGYYSTVDTVEYGETQPEGMAKAIYDGVSVLHYSGSVTTVDEQVNGAVTVGKRLNIIGGNSAYAGMNALVQQITENIDRGRTAITLGPPSHLGPMDLIEQLRAFRERRVWTNPLVQTTGEIQADAAGGGGYSGKQFPSQNTVGNHEVPKSLSILHPVTVQTGGQSTRPPGGLLLYAGLCGGETLQPRDYKYCENGVNYIVKLVGGIPRPV